LRYRKQKTGWLKEFEADLRKYEDKAEKMRQSRNIRNVIPRSGKLVITGGNAPTIDDSTPNKVYLR
jgi:hypothetical protein